MDPNETLRRVLAARRDAEKARDVLESTDAEIEALWEFANATDELFTWLSNEGFQPDWRMVEATAAGVLQSPPGVWVLVVESAYGDEISVEVFADESRAYSALAFAYPVDGGPYGNSELVAAIETQLGHSVYIARHEIAAL